MFKKIKLVLLSALAAVTGLVSTPVLADPPDLSSMTAAVDFSTVVTALLGVGAAIIVVYIAWKGAKMLIGAVKSA